MPIPHVTSVADLLFKAKTQELYNHVLFKAVKSYIYTEGRKVETLEQAKEELSKYLKSCTNCVMMTHFFNITCDSITEENKIHIVKNREAISALNPQVQSRGQNINFIEDYYQSLNRWARRTQNENVTIEFSPLTTVPGAVRDTISITGTSREERVIAQRTIPNYFVGERRQQLESELQQEMMTDIRMRIEATIQERARRVSEEVREEWNNWNPLNPSENL